MRCFLSFIDSMILTLNVSLNSTWVTIKNKYICNPTSWGEVLFGVRVTLQLAKMVPLIYIALIPSAFWFKLSWIPQTLYMPYFPFTKFSCVAVHFILESP